MREGRNVRSVRGEALWICSGGRDHVRVYRGGHGFRQSLEINRGCPRLLQGQSKSPLTPLLQRGEPAAECLQAHTASNLPMLLKGGSNRSKLHGPFPPFAKGGLGGICFSALCREMSGAGLIALLCKRQRGGMMGMGLGFYVRGEPVEAYSPFDEFRANGLNDKACSRNRDRRCRSARLFRPASSAVFG